MKKYIFLVVASLVGFVLKGGVYDDFAARLPALRASIPDITKAAEAAAEAIYNHPQRQLEIPQAECAGFCEEMIGRAGGLTQIGYKSAEPGGVLLYAVRDWERLNGRGAFLVDGWLKEGKIVILFGSKNGKPDDVNPTFFIDNGAPDGFSTNGVVNATANATLGWMFCTEYAAAFTRAYNKFPAVTKSIAPVDAWLHNAANNTPDRSVRFFDCEEKIPAGELALVYWHRIKKLVSDMREPDVMGAIKEAAGVISDKIMEGRRVGIAGLGHLILEEAKHDIRSPIIGFRAVSMLTTSLETVLDKGDLLVWISYAGMNTHWANYVSTMKNCGLDLIVSFSTRALPENIDEYCAFIPQRWSLPDAEVAIPVTPGLMAPVSAINRVVLTHMIDDAVCDELKARGFSWKKEDALDKQVYDPTRFSEFGAMKYGQNLNIWGNRDKDDAFLVYPEDGTNGASPRLYNSPPAQKDAPIIPNGWSNMAKFKEGTIFATNGLWGVAATDGRVTIEPKYEMINWLSNKLLIIQSNRKFGLASWDGNVVQPLVFDMIQGMGWGMAAFSKGLKFGILDDQTGEVLIDPFFDLYPNGVNNDCISGLKDGAYGLYTKKGAQILPPVFNAIGQIRGDGVLVFKDGYWYELSISSPQKELIPSKTYTEVSYLPRNEYSVKKGRLYGVLNGDGSVKIPVEYDYIMTHLGLGESLLRKDGRWYLQDSDNKISAIGWDAEWIDFSDQERDRQKRSAIPEPKYRVKRNGKYGFVDSDGKTVIPFNYSFAYGFNNKGCAIVSKGGEWRLDKNVWPMLHKGLYGVIDREGIEIVPAKFAAVFGIGRDRWQCIIRNKDIFMTP